MIDTSEATQAAFHARGFPLMEFDRRPLDRHLLRGFMLAVTEHFTLVHLVEGETFGLNGYALFPNRTVRRWRCLGPQTFFSRAAKYKRLRPSLPDNFQLETWQEVLNSAGAQFPLLTIHREKVEKNACRIGRFIKVSQRSVVIDYINPEAIWDGPDTYKLNEITRVDFGGAYESVLAALAPPTPIL